MQFPESWLREFCDPPLNTQQLSDLLTMSGMEVEEVRTVAPPFTGVVVAPSVKLLPPLVPTCVSTTSVLPLSLSRSQALAEAAPGKI